MYPAGYDVLISKHEMLVNMSSIFDDVHQHLSDLRKTNPSNPLVLNNKPHKVIKYVNEQLTNYIHDYKPAYLDGEASHCDDGGCIPTRQLGDGVVGCELCDRTFYLYEIKEECVA